jgi:NAD(P)-dependent dehydrogenase (short-subunit alcohol dehydrogenase family)
MNYFKGKVAIVTGGASGIGRALCREIAERGAAAVIIADINGEQARDVASAICARGGKADFRQIDVSQAEAIQNLLDCTLSQYGRVDFMFNNAGIAIGGEVKDMTMEQWQRIMAVNLYGVIYGTTKAYAIMCKQGFGHIVNTASLAGLCPSPIVTAYSTTKHAVVGLSTSLRLEAKNMGVKVSVVCPGFVQTGIYDAAVMVTKLKDKNFRIDAEQKIMDADKCARIILRGVESNKAIITVTALARIMWLLYRFNPAIIEYVWQKPIKKFRSLYCD